MDIKQIRNATIVVQYAGKKFLVDPMLSEKGSMPPFGEGVGFPPAPRQDQNNPLVNLPTSIENIIADLDAVIVTHMHPDHWDDAAVEALPKDIKLFVQNDEDAKVITEAGFTNVEVLQKDTMFGDIQFIKTKGEHGRGPVIELKKKGRGDECKHPSERTRKLGGGTVRNEEETE